MPSSPSKSQQSSFHNYNSSNHPNLFYQPPPSTSSPCSPSDFRSPPFSILHRSLPNPDDPNHDPRAFADPYLPGAREPGVPMPSAEEIWWESKKKLDEFRAMQDNMCGMLFGGRQCPFVQYYGSLFCIAHSCKMILEDGTKCLNRVTDSSGCCTTGYHCENGRLPLLYSPCNLPPRQDITCSPSSSTSSLETIIQSPSQSSANIPGRDYATGHYYNQQQQQQTVKPHQYGQYKAEQAIRQKYPPRLHGHSHDHEFGDGQAHKRGRTKSCGYVPGYIFGGSVKQMATSKGLEYELPERRDYISPVLLMKYGDRYNRHHRRHDRYEEEEADEDWIMMASPTSQPTKLRSAAPDKPSFCI